MFHTYEEGSYKSQNVSGPLHEGLLGTGVKIDVLKVTGFNIKTHVFPSGHL